MTPEQREELKPCPFCGGAARIESNRDWHRLYADHDEDCALYDANDLLMFPAQPGYLKEIADLWNRRAQVEALTVPQWQPIETAPQDGYMLVHEDGAIRAKLRFNGEWQHVAYPAIIGQWGDAIVGEDATRLLPAGCRLEMRDGCCEESTHWKPMDAAPTIPAIPGTKEDA